MIRGTVGLGMALVLLGPGQALGQAGRTQVDEGNRLYEAGEYEAAHEKYLEALREAPESPLVRYNAGNALYQTEEFQRALESYRAAVEGGDPTLQARAWYNVGNAFYRQQRLQESLEAYRQALRIDPDDVDAKHNLELVLEELERQQDQQSPNDQDRSDEQNQDQNDDRSQQSQDPGEDRNQDDPRDPDSDNPQDQDDQGQQDEPRDQDGPDEEPNDDPQQRPTPPPPGQMTREEAERLLQAIQEDPEQAGRQRAAAATGRRPRKKW